MKKVIALSPSVDFFSLAISLPLFTSVFVNILLSCLRPSVGYSHFRESGSRATEVPWKPSHTGHMLLWQQSDRFLLSLPLQCKVEL